jgi:glycerophosphoryl diester phosphodiesterase
MIIPRLLAFLAAMCALTSNASAPLIIAHRGASYDAPENTLSAFKLAIEQRADGFEADFYLGAGGQILCLHDKDTERVSGKKLLVVEAPFDELRGLDVGKWKDVKWQGERMPTMEEVLEAVPPGKKIFIELKSSTEIVAPMAKLLESSSLSPNQIVVISFHAEAVAESKKLMPHIKALWLCSFKKKKDKPPPPTVEEVAATLKRIRADGLNAEAVPEYVDARFICRLRELGCCEFSVWTVDDPKIAQFYKCLGAWSITTNRPGYLREQLAHPQPQYISPKRKRGHRR